MTQYISKSVLIAEVKRRRESNAKERYFGRLVEDNYFLDLLDTLEVKESLIWQDIRLISEICESFMNSEKSDNLSEEEYYTEILNKFKAQKHETDII